MCYFYKQCAWARKVPTFCAAWFHALLTAAWHTSLSKACMHNSRLSKRLPNLHLRELLQRLAFRYSQYYGRPKWDRQTCLMGLRWLKVDSPVQRLSNSMSLLTWGFQYRQKYRKHHLTLKVFSIISHTIRKAWEWQIRIRVFQKEVYISPSNVQYTKSNNNECHELIVKNLRKVKGIHNSCNPLLKSTGVILYRMAGLISLWNTGDQLCIGDGCIWI